MRGNQADGEVRKVRLNCAKKMYKREGDSCTKDDCLSELRKQRSTINAKTRRLGKTTW